MVIFYLLFSLFILSFIYINGFRLNIVYFNIGFAVLQDLPLSPIFHSFSLAIALLLSDSEICQISAHKDQVQIGHFFNLKSTNLCFQGPLL